MVLSAAVTFAMQGLIACAVNGYLTFYSPLPPARYFLSWVIFYTGASGAAA